MIVTATGLLSGASALLLALQLVVPTGAVGTGDASPGSGSDIVRESAAALELVPSPPPEPVPTPEPTAVVPTIPAPPSMPVVKPTPPPAAKPVYRYILAPAWTLSRAGSGAVVHRLARGAKVQLVRPGGDWSIVRSGMRNGWIRTDRIAVTKPAALPRNPRSSLVLVNKKYALVPGSYVPKTVAVRSTRLAPSAAKAHDSMVRSAGLAGVRLQTLSGYRSYATQSRIFSHYQRLYGTAYASKISARPGMSEHQTGLAVDFGTANGGCRLLACFATTREGKWLAANSHRYGFILRYPKGQELVTGYNHEPWHYRYVGVATATTMKSKRTPTYEHHLHLAAR